MDFLFGLFRILFFPRRKRLTLSQRKCEYDIMYEKYLLNFEDFLTEDGRHFQMKARRNFLNEPGEVVKIPTIDPIGIDRRRRQISYGLMPGFCHREVNLSEGFNPSVSHHTSVERGAALVFNRSDNGVVSVLLYTPRTDNLRHVDSAYKLHSLVPGLNGTSKGAFIQISKYFRSVAERYSLDGEPDFFDHWRAFVLYWFYERVSDGKMLPPRASGFASSVLKLVLTVGLSGFLLKIIEVL